MIFARCPRKYAINLTRRPSQQINSFRQNFSTTSSNRDKDEEGPPQLPSTCCMSGEGEINVCQEASLYKCYKGCANCVWLDYAEEVVRYYDSRGMTSNFEELLDTVDKNVEDPMVKAFVKMELKSKYLFNQK